MPKQKQVKNETFEDICIYWFSRDPISTMGLSVQGIDGLKNKISKIKYKPLNKKKIDIKKITRNDAIEKLKLNAKIDPAYIDIIQLLESNFDNFRNNKKAVETLTPLIYRVLIRYVSQVENYIQAGSLQDLENGLHLIKVLLAINSDMASDGMELLKMIFNKLEDFWEKSPNSLENYQSKLMSELFKIICYKTGSPLVVEILHFMTLIFEKIVKLYGTDNLNDKKITIIEAMVRDATSLDMPKEYMDEYIQRYIYPLINITKELMEKMITTQNSATYVFYSICIDLIIGTANKYQIHQYLIDNDLVALTVKLFELLNDLFPDVKRDLVEIPEDFLQFSSIENLHFNTIPDKVWINEDGEKMSLIDSYQRAKNSPDRQYKLILANKKEISNYLIKLLNAQTGPLKNLLIDMLLKTYFESSEQKEEKISTTFLILYFFTMYNKSVINEIFTKNNIWKKIFSSHIFDVKYTFTQTDDELMKIYHLVRIIYFDLIEQCFCSSNNEEEQKTILNEVSNFLKVSGPQLSEDVIYFISKLFQIPKTNPNKEPINVSQILNFYKSQFFQGYVNYQYMLQLVYLRETNENIRKQIHEYRNSLLLLQNECFSSELSKIALISSKFNIDFYFHLLFEKESVDFAKDILIKCLSVNKDICKNGMSPYETIFSNITDLIKESEKHIEEENWLSLLFLILTILIESFRVNGDSLIPLLEKYDFLQLILNNTKIVVKKLGNDSNLYIQKILSFICVLTFNNNVSQKIVYKKPRNFLGKLSDIISTIVLEQKSINLILELIFEKQMDIQNLKGYSEIKFFKALPFLHYSTYKLPEHHILINYLATICQNSFTNCLHVYQSKLTIAILHFIKSFSDLSGAKDDEKKSIECSFNLFTFVSSYLFKPRTFLESMNLLKSTGGNRFWYTKRLVSSFLEILNQSNSKLPSSFFHFAGVNSSMNLPTIPATYLSKGMSFIFRFYLDAEYEIESQKPCLFQLQTSNGVSITVSIVDKKIEVECVNEKKPNSASYRSKEDMHFNCWSFFIMTIKSNNCKIYVNGNKIIMFSLAKYKVDSIQKWTIAKRVDNKNYLTCNISVLYLFSQAFSKKILLDFLKLPLDFVSNFVPTNKNLFTGLPPSLFHGDIEDSLIFCFNSRISNGKNCINLSQKLNQCSSFEGHVVPYSSTFVRTIVNMGMNSFIPLFNEVEKTLVGIQDYPSEKSEFLCILIGFFNALIQSSNYLEDSFFTSNGFKALCNSLTFIKNDTFNTEFFKLLKDLFINLKSDNYRIEMIKYMFFNPNLWKSLSFDIHKEIVCDLLDMFNHNYKEFLEAMSFPQLLTYIVQIKDEKIRSLYWKFISEFTKKRFSDLDKNILFKYPSSIESPNIIIDVLQFIEQLVNEKVFDCQLLLSQPVYYLSFIKFAANSNEMVRILAMKFIINTNNLISKGLISPNKYTIEASIFSYIELFSHVNLTEKTWEEMTNLFFETPKFMSALYPFISFLSVFYNGEPVRQFLNNLLSTLQKNQTLIDQFLNTAWYGYTFYLHIQTNAPVFELNDDIPSISLFSLFMNAALFKQKPQSFSNAISFFNLFQLNNKCDMMVFINLIFKRMLSEPNIKDSSSKYSDIFYSYIFPEIFSYLFIIPSYDPSYYNLELQNQFNYDVNIIAENSINTSFLLEDKVDEISKNEYTDIEFSLNSRFQANQKWIDIELAKQFCETILSFSSTTYQKSIFIQKNQFIVIEILSFIIGYIVRADFDSNYDFLSKFTNAISGINNELASRCVSIILYFLYPISFKSATYKNQLISFINGLHLKQKLQYESLPDFYGFVSSDWVQSLQSIPPQQKKSYIQNFTKTIQSILELSCKIDMESEIEAQSSKKVPLIDRISMENQQIFSYNQLLCEKSYKHITQELKSKNNVVQHWKLSPYLDLFNRHIFFKPNHHFDDHKMASLLRDSASKEQAVEVLQQLSICSQEHELNEEEETLDDTLDEEEDIFDESSYYFSCEANLIKLETIYKGKFFINDKEIFFTDKSIKNDETDKSSRNDETCKSIQIPLGSLRMVLQRNYIHLPVGLEFFIKTRKSIFICFGETKYRKKVLNFLAKKKLPTLSVLQLSKNVSSIWSEKKFTEKWQNGLMSNYEYLVYVNLFAGRSFNDLTQYPVFPWVLADYKSETIDLNDEKYYRDLTKPLGAINEERLNNLIEMSKEVFDDPSQAYLYRIHYSTSYFVTYYLLRLEPFTSINIKMQDNKFDQSTRIFSSIESLWSCISSPVLNEFRELIPEFYSTPEFLINTNKFDLGNSSDGKPINDVILPKWAKDPYDFISIQKEALESNYVSSHIQNWIDLVFGYKQKGKASVDANNTFHPYSYSSCITKSVLKDPTLLNQCQQFAMNFGITPQQIFINPHPKKLTLSTFKIPTFNPVLVTKVTSQPIFMKYDSNCLIIIMSNGHLLVKSKNETNEYDLMRYIGTNDNLDEKTFTYAEGILIAASYLDSSFHIFQVDDNSLKLLSTIYQNSLNVSISNPFYEHVIAATRDSTIVKYVLSSSTSTIYRISPHTAPIITIASNYILNLLVSCDKSRMVVLSNLKHGTFIQSFLVSSPIIKIQLTNDPCILVAHEGQKDKSVYISSYGINCNFISQIEINSSSFAWCVIRVNQTTSLLAISDQNKKLKFFSLPSLKLINEFNVGISINSLTYSQKNQTLYYSSDDSKVYSINFH